LKVDVILLAHGTVEVYVKETLTKTLKPGEAFGEMALLYNAPRSAEIRCVNQCKLWGVDRITFRKALEEMITRNFEENRRFIENISFFGNPLFSTLISIYRLHVKCLKRRCIRSTHHGNLFKRTRNCM
jgi:CRP-like cAMP-binding protein